MAALPAYGQAADMVEPVGFVEADGAAAGGPALGVDEEPEEGTVGVGDRSQVIYDLVSESYLVTSYDNTRRRAPSQTDAPFNRLFRHDLRADLHFAVFADTDSVDGLSQENKDRLLTSFDTGDLILGAQGYGRDLKHALGLISSDLYAAGTTTGGEDMWGLLHRNANGRLDELTIAAPTDDDSLQTAFHYARAWYNRHAATETDELAADIDEAAADALGDDSDPWEAIHNFEWTGTISGDFDGDSQTPGTYTFLVSVYFLDDAEDQDTDYYRLDFGTVIGISSYEMTGNDFGDTAGNCGWWDNSQQVAVTVTTEDGQWWPTGFMPDTTIGSTSTTFTIGGDIGTSGGDGTASYSQTYGTSDVTIEVFSDSVAEWLKWTAALVGCSNYSWYPDYDGASDAAKSTYSLDPSFIAAVQEGSDLEFETTADGDDWQFEVEKDHIYCGFGCFTIEHSDNKTTYTMPVTATCDTTGCS
jgi:hypothetical protein